MSLRKVGIQRVFIIVYVLSTVFEITDNRLTFLVTLPIHEGCGESSETDLLGSETHNESSERKRKSSERNVDTMKDVYNCIDRKNVAEGLRYVFIYSKCQ